MDFFISYRHGDNIVSKNNLASGYSIAKNYLYEPLKRKGYEVYFGPKRKKIGEYPQHLEDAVKDCKVFLWVLSQGCFECRAHDNENDWYFAEVMWAIKYKKAIYPILSPDFEMPSNDYIHDQFKKAFEILKGTLYFTKKDSYIPKKVSEMFHGAISGRRECIYIDSDYDINLLILPVKRSGVKIKKHKKLKQRLLVSLCIFFSMLLLIVVGKKIYYWVEANRVWDGKKDNSWNNVKGDGTANNPYQIKKASQLAWLAYSSQSNSYVNTYFVLKNDIVLNEYHTQGIQNDIENSVENGEIAILSPDVNQWVPVGNEEYPFAGHFDGGGHVVSGMYIATDKNYQGLFGVCAEDSSIENVNIQAATIRVSGIGIGGIAGKSDGLINNCNVYSLFLTGGGYAGGIAGIAHEVINSFTHAWIMGYNHSYEEVSGKFTLSEELRKCYGGIAGYCDYVINSAASVYMYGTYKVNGGLVGELNSDAYNCIALGVSLSDKGYISENDNAWLTGDLFGQYNGNATKEVSKKQLYYIVENNLDFVADDEQLKVAKEKFPDIQYEKEKYAPVNIKTWKYVNHEFSLKTGKYNELSTNLPNGESAVTVLNENLEYIEYGTDVQAILEENGTSGKKLELIEWVIGNDWFCVSEIETAPWLKTTNNFKTVLGLN